MELCSNSVQDKGQIYCVSLLRKFQEVPQSAKEQREKKANETKKVGMRESVQEVRN